PSSPIAFWLWKWKMTIQGTFALSMLESWEQFILIGICTVLSVLLLTALVKYMPHHLAFLMTRARYYLSGNE
ncbi:hypothetical protein SISNIDRAFT_384755, partial [Sistotremastrum niveocremeum HHB9708]